ncbi:MAG: class I SAM-dependent methyltransferase [Bacteroidota bacterium]
MSRAGLTADQMLVKDDNRDFYGKEYWFSHQSKNLGFPNILERARNDLPERCLHWLRSVLKYKLPPANVLELGCGHGGFVALLRRVGFDAVGLELSPWVVEFARHTFGVPMLLGPVEEQPIEHGSLDVIALMDVLEHLPDPLSTIQRCVSLLQPEGIMMIQTPCYPHGKSYERLLEEKNAFLEMLQEEEHLYLFSENAIRQFFRRLEAQYLAFEPALFAQYDMFLVVSREPLVVNPREAIEGVLAGTPESRIVQALLDCDEHCRELTIRLQESDLDRATRLEQIHELTARLQESESDRVARLEQINTLTKWLKEAQANR